MQQTTRHDLLRAVARSEMILSELARRFVVDEEGTELSALSFCEGTSTEERLRDSESHAALVLLAVADRFIAFEPYFPDEVLDADDSIVIRLTKLGTQVLRARVAAGIDATTAAPTAEVG